MKVLLGDPPRTIAAARAIQRPLTRTYITQSFPDCQPALALPGILDAPAPPWQCQPRAVEAAQRSLVPGAAAARVSEATDPRRVASRGGFRRLQLLSKSQLAGAGGQVGLGHKVRLAQRLTGAQAAMDRLRVVPAGCRTPLPTPPEAASLLSFRSQLIHYPQRIL